MILKQHVNLYIIQIGHEEELPQSLPENYVDNEELLRKIHHILLEVRIKRFFTDLKFIFLFCRLK